jgi:hypothetical protein
MHLAKNAGSQVVGSAANLECTNFAPNLHLRRRQSARRLTKLPEKDLILVTWVTSLHLRRRLVSPPVGLLLPLPLLEDHCRHGIRVTLLSPTNPLQTIAA